MYRTQMPSPDVRPNRRHVRSCRYRRRQRRLLDPQPSRRITVAGRAANARSDAVRRVSYLPAGRATHGRAGRGGKIEIISSVHAELAVPRSAAYNMAKAAMTHLGATMAGELAAHRINVNVILPGWIDTPENAPGTQEEMREAVSVPWGRLGTPDDIGGVVAFLVGPDADYITGSTLRWMVAIRRGACRGVAPL